MPTATATKLSTDELLLALASSSHPEGGLPLDEALKASSEQALSLAWMRGEIEFGRTKYVVTGNPANPIDNHNGVVAAQPAVIIEGGYEWTGPKQRWHSPFAKLKAEKLPACPRYQKYQLEVCVNKEKDVWEWLEEGVDADGRDTRFARRNISRADAEKLFAFHVRLTDKGAAALSE